MLDLKSLIIGVVFGVALVFSLGASHKKKKDGASSDGHVSALYNPK